jgi:hypothetical protein
VSHLIAFWYSESARNRESAEVSRLSDCALLDDCCDSCHCSRIFSEWGISVIQDDDDDARQMGRKARILCNTAIGHKSWEGQNVPIGIGLRTKSNFFASNLIIFNLDK